MNLDSQIVGDALLAIGPVVAAVIAARAVRYGQRNADKLDKVISQTNGEMNAKIRAGFEQVFREHPRLVGQALLDEEMRDLLNAIFLAATDERN